MSEGEIGEMTKIHNQSRIPGHNGQPGGAPGKGSKTELLRRKRDVRQP